MQTNDITMGPLPATSCRRLTLPSCLQGARSTTVYPAERNALAEPGDVGRSYRQSGSAMAEQVRLIGRSMSAQVTRPTFECNYGSRSGRSSVRHGSLTDNQQSKDEPMQARIDMRAGGQRHCPN